MTVEITQDLARDLLQQALARGAAAADLLLLEGESFSAQVRIGQVDTVKQAREKVLGLRIFFGQRSACASTSDLSPSSLEQLVEDTCAMARLTAEDPYAGLPDPTACAREVADMDLWDDALPALSVEARIDMARQAEASAFAHDPRITNSDGGDLSCGGSRIILANTSGFVGEYRSSSITLSVVPIAQANGSMQRDYWYSVKRKLRDLEEPERIGEIAAQRAVRRLGARKIATCVAPVVFDPETAAGLLGHLAGAVSGYAVYKNASFLVGKLGETIAASEVNVYDDATLPAGLGSKPFDGEGLPTRRTTVVQQGVLQSYLLDTYAARKLNLASTGNAARGAGDTPTVSPTNFFLAPGPHSPEEIIRSVKSGLYVTELIGFGVNPVTGDYSRGAVGLWIENGEPAYPVEEITIAGNLLEIYRNIEMAGNDLTFHRRIAAPTLKIARMHIGGD